MLCIRCDVRTHAYINTDIGVHVRICIPTRTLIYIYTYKSTYVYVVHTCMYMLYPHPSTSLPPFFNNTQKNSYHAIYIYIYMYILATRKILLHRILAVGLGTLGTLGTYGDITMATRKIVVHRLLAAGLGTLGT